MNKYCAPLFASLLLCACEPSEQPAQPVTASPPATAADEVTNTVQRQLSEQFWHAGDKALGGAIETAAQMRAQLANFLRQSDETQLQKLRDSWHRAHNSYSAWSSYRALTAGNPGLFGLIAQSHFDIDAEPIQPGYLDSFGEYQHSGIVNDLALPISADAVRAQHGFSDSEDVSLGFHAIEYLLFGEDGQRPLTQLQQSSPNSEQKANGLTPSQLPENRRRALLKLLCELLIDDLNALQRQWRGDDSPLSAAYQALPLGSRLELIRQANIHAAGELLVALQNRANELAHNRYAGGDRDRAAAIAAGIEQALPEPLARELLREQADAWRAQMTAAITALEAGDEAQAIKYLAAATLLWTPPES